MRLTVIIVTVIFTALFTYARLISLASQPAREPGFQDTSHRPAALVHAAIVLPDSH
ncbi:MAG TPA: hypothetical protein VGG44_06835 [Tepidisphaeraceae bacterium]|jgi:hypothetical protein